MKSLLNMIMLFSVATALAHGDYAYKVEIQGQFEELEQRLVDEWQKEHPSQLLNLDAFAQLRSTSKRKAVFSPYLLTLSGQESVVKAVEELMFPTELKVDSFTNAVGQATSVLRQSNFEMREIGYTFLVCTEIEETDDLDIHLSFNAEITDRPTWHDYPARMASSTGSETTVHLQQPFFYTRSLRTSVILKSGREAIVGSGMADRDGKTVTFILLKARVVDSEGQVIRTKHVDANPPEPCISLGDDSRAVIFPKSRARELIKHVCYKAPPGISEYWTPTAEDLKNVESSFPAYLDEVKPAAKDTWPRLHRQITGVMKGEDRFLFISYFLMDALQDANNPQKTAFAERWKSKPYWVCDGGEYYFRVLYDVKRKKYVWFECNGRA